MREYDYYTLRHSRYGGIDVLGWGTHPESSCLAGQAMKVFLGSFDTVEEARAKYPQAENFSSRWTEPQVSVAHLNPDGDLGGPDGYGDRDDN